MPYFLRSEHYTPGANAHHAVGGPLHLIRPTAPHPVTEAYMAAGAEIGIAPTDDHNGARMTGPCLNTLTIKEGKRQTIADAYLAPALGPAESASDGGDAGAVVAARGDALPAACASLIARASATSWRSASSSPPGRSPRPCC
jgi:choline dehydrogenase-like flavoprotein